MERSPWIIWTHCNHNVITRSFIIQWGQRLGKSCESERKGQRDAALSQGVQAASGGQKGQGKDSPSEHPEGAGPRRHLDDGSIEATLEV